MARPQKEATLTADQIERMASVGCTDTEIASLAGIDERTLKRDFAPLLKNGRNTMRDRLRTAQIRKALGVWDEDAQVFTVQPDTTLLIWMGKQYLGQSDKTENRNIDMSKLTDDELRAIAKS